MRLLSTFEEAEKQANEKERNENWIDKMEKRGKKKNWKLMWFLHWAYRNYVLRNDVKRYLTASENFIWAGEQKPFGGG